MHLILWSYATGWPCWGTLPGSTSSSKLAILCERTDSPLLSKIVISCRSISCEGCTNKSICQVNKESWHSFYMLCCKADGRRWIEGLQTAGSCMAMYEGRWFSVSSGSVTFSPPLPGTGLQSYAEEFLDHGSLLWNILIVVAHLPQKVIDKQLTIYVWSSLSPKSLFCPESDGSLFTVKPASATSFKRNESILRSKIYLVVWEKLFQGWIETKTTPCSLIGKDGIPSNKIAQVK